MALRRSPEPAVGGRLSREQVLYSRGDNPPDISMLRVHTSDGLVLVTCSRLDARMVVTLSPHRGR